MNFVARVLISVVFGVAASFATASAQNVTSGGTVMKSPVNIVNLFWDARWDGDHGGTGTFATGPAPTVAAINAFTRALASTPVSYFSKTGQYSRDGAPFALGSTQSHPPGPFCSTIAPTVVNSLDIVNWVTCEVEHDPAVPHVASDALDTLYVVYLPASTRVRNGGVYESCIPSTTGTFVAYHSSSITKAWPFVVVPLSCHRTMSALTASAVHEIIESMTDPINSGWKRSASRTITLTFPLPAPPPPFPAPGPLLITVSDTGEIADMPCDNTTSFFGLSVVSYWSNSDGACVVGNSVLSSYNADLQVAPVDTIKSFTSQALTTVSGAPATFALAENIDHVVVSPAGVVSVGAIAADRDFIVRALAMDGSGRTAATKIRALAALHISPERSSIGGSGGSIPFHEDHQVSVLYTMVADQGGDFGSLDRNTGVYNYPFPTSHHSITITARSPDGRTADAFIEIIPVFLRKGSNDAVAAQGQTVLLQRLQPTKPTNLQRARPSLGVRYVLKPDIGTVRDGVYVAPTRAQLAAAGYQPSQPVLVQITATDAQGQTFTRTVKIIPR